MPGRALPRRGCTASVRHAAQQSRAAGGGTARRGDGTRADRGGRRGAAPGPRAPCGDEEDALGPDGDTGCARRDHTERHGRSIDAVCVSHFTATAQRRESWHALLRRTLSWGAWGGASRRCHLSQVDANLHRLNKNSNQRSRQPKISYSYSKLHKNEKMQLTKQSK